MPEGSGELMRYVQVQHPNCGDREAALDNGGDDDHDHSKTNLNRQMALPDGRLGSIHAKLTICSTNNADADILIERAALEQQSPREEPTPAGSEPPRTMSAKGH